MEKTRISRRQFLTLAGTASGAALLTACAAPPAPPAPQPAGEEAAAPAQEPVAIKYWWCWGAGAYSDGCQAMADVAMELNPEIIVETLPGGAPCGGGSGMEKMLTSIASGDTADVFTITDEALDAWLVRRVPAPINEYVDASTTTTWDTLIDVAWKSGTRDGVTYMMPWNNFPATALYLNKNLLGEAGLPADRGPQTLDEIFEWTKELTKFDEAGNLVQMGYYARMGAGWNADAWVTIWNTNWYDSDKKQFTIDTPEFVEVVEWIASYPQFFGVDKFQSFTSTFTGWMDSAQSGFIQETMSMTWEGPWANGGLLRWNPELMENTGIDWHPAVDGKKVQTWATWGSIIPNISQHKDEAWLLMETLGSYEGQAAFYEKVPMFVPNKEFGAQQKAEETNPLAIWWWNVPDEQERIFTADCPLWDEGITKINGTVDQVVFGEKPDARAAMAELQEDLQRELEDLLERLG